MDSLKSNVEAVIKILDEMGVFDRWVDRVAAAVVERMPAARPSASNQPTRGDALRDQIFRYLWSRGGDAVTRSELQAMKIGNWYTLQEELARMVNERLLSTSTRKLKRGIVATDYELTPLGDETLRVTAKRLNFTD